jgi:hypothetical protein
MRLFGGVVRLLHGPPDDSQASQGHAPRGLLEHGFIALGLLATLAFIGADPLSEHPDRMHRLHSNLSNNLIPHAGHSESMAGKLVIDYLRNGRGNAR